VPASRERDLDRHRLRLHDHESLPRSLHDAVHGTGEGRSAPPMLHRRALTQCRGGRDWVDSIHSRVRRVRPAPPCHSAGRCLPVPCHRAGFSDPLFRACPDAADRLARAMLAIERGGFLTMGSCTMELRPYWPKTSRDIRHTGAAVTAPLTGARANLRRWEKQP
jgi:hypothetical protein